MSRLVTPEVKAEAVRLARAGELSNAAIGRRLGLDESTVRKYCREAGLRKRPAFRRVFTAADRDRAVRLFNLTPRLSLLEIARICKADRQSVRHWLRAAGIDPKRAPIETPWVPTTATAVRILREVFRDRPASGRGVSA